MSEDIENVTLENLLQNYEMTLTEIARIVEADSSFVDEATRYLLDVPAEITDENQKKEFLKERLNTYMKSGLCVPVVLEIVAGKTIEDCLSEENKTLREVAKDIGIVDEDASDIFIAQATASFLKNPEKGNASENRLYAFNKFDKYALSGLDLSVAADMTDMRRTELVELASMTNRMCERDLGLIEEGVKQGLSFDEICQRCDWPVGTSLSEIAALQGYDKAGFKKKATRILLSAGKPEGKNSQDFSKERFAKYVNAGLDLGTLCEEVQAQTLAQKEALCMGYYKQIIASDVLTVKDLMKQLGVSHDEQKLFSQKVTQALLTPSFEETSVFKGDAQAAVLSNLERFSYAGLNLDTASAFTGLDKSDIEKEFIKPAKLHKKALINFARTSFADAANGSALTKASRFFANKSAKSFNKAREAQEQENDVLRNINVVKGKMYKGFSLAGKGIEVLKQKINKPKEFVDDKINQQIMKVGDRNETAGRVLSTVKGIVDSSAEALVVGSVAFIVSPAFAVPASAAVTAMWGCTHLNSARKSLTNFYGKAADSYRKDATKTPAQNRARSNRSIGKYVNSHKSDLHKAWIKSGMSLAYGVVGASAMMKVSPEMTLNAFAGYSSTRSAIKYTRRGVNGIYMLKDDLKDLSQIKGHQRRMQFATTKVLTGAALLAVGSSADSFSFSNIEMENGFKSGDFFYIPVMDNTYLTSNHAIFADSLNELRSNASKTTTGLTLDQIARAHGYDVVQTAQFNREMTKNLLNEGKTQQEKESLFKKHAVDGIDLQESFKILGISDPKDVIKRSSLVQSNVVALASSGISLNEMSEAIGLKGAKRKEFVSNMTTVLLNSTQDATDKKQAMLEAIQKYGSSGLDKKALYAQASKNGLHSASLWEMSVEAVALAKRQEKQELKAGRQLIKDGLEKQKQAKEAMLNNTKDFLKDKASSEFFARLRAQNTAR